MGHVPGSLLNREETWRTLEWIDRQRANPMARLGGERVRYRSALFLDPQKDLAKLQKNQCGRVVIANMDFGQGSKSSEYACNMKFFAVL